MKIRSDFVTNSSSSSFLVARKGNGEVSKAGREKLADLLLNRFLGESGRRGPATKIKGITPENIAKHEDFEYRGDKCIAAGKSALEDGFDLIEGYINYEDAESQLASILEAVFEILSEDDNFRVIDGDLTY